MQTSISDICTEATSFTFLATSRTGAEAKAFEKDRLERKDNEFLLVITRVENCMGVE